MQSAISMDLKGQLAGASFFLPPWGSEIWNSGHQTCCQAPSWPTSLGSESSLEAQVYHTPAFSKTVLLTARLFAPSLSLWTSEVWTRYKKNYSKSCSRTSLTLFFTSLNQVFFHPWYFQITYSRGHISKDICSLNVTQTHMVGSWILIHFSSVMQG